MPDRITRREFIRGSAMLAGAVVVFDPSWLFGDLGANPERSNAALGSGPGGRQGVGGPDAQIEFLEGADGPIVRWTRLGDEYTLELRQAYLLIDVPTRAETIMSVSLEDFERGRGHQEVVHFFGAPTLERLRTEISYREVLLGQ